MPGSPLPPSSLSTIGGAVPTVSTVYDGVGVLGSTSLIGAGGASGPLLRPRNHLSVEEATLYGGAANGSFGQVAQVGTQYGSVTADLLAGAHGVLEAGHGMLEATSSLRAAEGYDPAAPSRGRWEAPGAFERAVARERFVADILDSAAISLEVGERVTVLAVIDGWATVRTQNGRQGRVPVGCLQKQAALPDERGCFSGCCGGLRRRRPRATMTSNGARKQSKGGASATAAGLRAKAAALLQKASSAKDQHRYQEGKDFVMECLENCRLLLTELRIGQERERLARGMAVEEVQEVTRLNITQEPAWQRGRRWDSFNDSLRNEDVMLVHGDWLATCV